MSLLAITPTTEMSGCQQNEINVSDTFKIGFCYFCQQDGKTSRLTVGGGSTTLSCTQSYYDENGIYHYHDSNWHTSSYSCSNGHYYQIREIKGCSACGKQSRYYLKELTRHVLVQG
jgi:hypothetical protein